MEYEEIFFDEEHKIVKEENLYLKRKKDESYQEYEARITRAMKGLNKEKLTELLVSCDVEDERLAPTIAFLNREIQRKDSFCVLI